ncbi:MAG: ROK family protein [Verrucomicrobiota bacterium]
MDYAIGIDFGGTKIEARLISDEGETLFTTRTPTEADKSKDHVVDNILKVIRKTEVEAGRKDLEVKGVGIGTPGFVLPDGRMALISNIPTLEGVPLRSEIQERMDIPVFLENDANCFALAEHTFGAGREYDHTVGIIWGTGIGSGIISDDRICRGHMGAAGEIGHAILNPDGELPCRSCGRKGDWESFCSAPNLFAYYRHWGGEKEDVTVQYIMNDSDPVATRVKEQSLHYMARGISFLISALNPDLVVLGGGISNYDSYEELNRRTNELVPESLKNTCRIRQFEIGDSAGVLGAAALVFKGIE